MSIYHKYFLYWLLVHAAVAGAAVYFLWDKRLWLLATECLIVLSFLAALWLSHELYKPIRIVREGFNLIKDSDLSTHFSPRGGQAEITLLVNTYNQIIEKLRKERQLLQEKQFFLEKVIQASETGLLILDYQEQIQLANPSASALLGGQQVWEGKTPSQLPYPFGDALAWLQTGESVMVMLPSRKRVRCLRGEFFDQGFPRAFITLDELTEELRKSELAAYEKLIRVLSHEINNSLASVSSLLHTCMGYAAQLNPEDRDDYQMAMQVMIARTAHLNQFMRSYANVVKVSKPSKQLSNVVEMLRGISMLFGSELQERSIRVEWNLDHKEHWIFLDQVQFEQALVNIIKNAIEAIDQHGSIRISLSDTGTQQSLLCIEDSGGGIPPEVKANLFTPFYSTKEQGQGIGLMMVQEVMLQHDFPFDLQSEPGQHTRFCIWMH